MVRFRERFERAMATAGEEAAAAVARFDEEQAMADRVILDDVGYHPDADATAAGQTTSDGDVSAERPSLVGQVRRGWGRVRSLPAGRVPSSSLPAYALLALGLAGLFAGAWLVVKTSPARLPISAERALVGRRQVRSSAVPPPELCRHPVRALGTEPLLDDFEDGDEGLPPLEGRNGYWTRFEDDSTPQRSHILPPMARRHATASNRLALHATGGKLEGWGASIGVRFGPSCYDLSAYRGIRFSALGPGRLEVGVLEVRVIPVEWGGSCVEECYRGHAKEIELEASWRNYELRWEELEQWGKPRRPLDPTRVQSLVFSVLPEDTPYDFWIDDMSFLR
jgi:hypothetical protein